MAIDKIKLVTLIASRPNIRCVEIADEMDMSVEQVAAIMESMIAAGEVVAEAVRSISGKMVTAYRMSQSKSDPEERVIPAYSTTYADRAKEYLARVGTATSAQLSDHLGIKSKTTSAYLKKPLDRGEFARRDGNWSIGGQKVTEAPRVIKSVVSVPEVELPAENLPDCTPTQKRRFACALWSNGDFSISIGDNTVVFHADEVRIMRAYLGERYHG